MGKREKMAQALPCADLDWFAGVVEKGDLLAGSVCKESKGIARKLAGLEYKSAVKHVGYKGSPSI